MRIALLSDIHGNAPALRAVLEDLESHGVEAYWILGDVLGYGPLPVTCIRMLDELSSATWLMGNHDLAALLLWEGRSTEDRSVGELTPGIDERLVALWHAEQLRVGLPEARIRDLLQAPTWRRMAAGVYAAHGAVLTNDPAAARNISGKHSYCKPHSVGCDLTLDQVQRLEEGTPPRLIVVGHTHVPALGWVHPANPRPGREWSWINGRELRFNESSPYPLEERGRGSVMLCPGSVGQPRGGGANLATCAIVDLEELTADFRRVEFDLNETRAAMEPMPRHLYELLLRERGR